MCSPSSNNGNESSGGWKIPSPHSSSSAHSHLVLNNTLTKSKVPFMTKDGTNRLTWYSCGPTVYDAAHIGHARNYVTFDIIRRIISTYFGYDVFYVMNITDIDDKIILRARQAHLLQEFKQENLLMTDKLGDFLWQSLIKYANSKLNVSLIPQNIAESINQIKNVKLDEEDAKGKMHVNTILKSLNALQNSVNNQSSQEVLNAMEDILAVTLDDLKGASVTDQRIFKDLALYWENDFWQDMKALNVLEPDVKTRVSEFIPQIIGCIQQIMENGFAYASEGSVYFDVHAFSNQHTYAKLCPQHAGNSKFFEEGEGTLGMKLTGKRDQRDFALWKCSKPGEPQWSSPWGMGRPGWHIECSAMANSVAPGSLDIHSGGIDLAFPHHDNEMAQSEAATNSQQWVNYFLHAGHVHIEGHKMSKSLKNFITIKECLNQYSSRQLRLMFLQHTWNQPLTFKESAMSAAVICEQTLIHFFATVQAILREGKKDAVHEWTNLEAQLSKQLQDCQNTVFEALSDSIDTPRALASLLDLVSQTNTYIKAANSTAIHPSILAKVAKYVTFILRVFGVASEGSPDVIGLATTGANVDDGNSIENSLHMVAQRVSEFRDQLRSLALNCSKLADEKIPERKVLELCDELRKDLVNAGVMIEDRAAPQSSLVKLISPDQIIQLKREEERMMQEKMEKLALNQVKQEAKRKQAQIEPGKMFLNDSSIAYGRFDDQGIPTHDASGQELSKNARKRVLKEYEQQCELHGKFLEGKL